MKRSLAAVVVLTVLAVACGMKELSYAEKEHQKQIETSLRFSERGWLVEATDGTIYKVQSVAYNGEVTNVQLFPDVIIVIRETVGRGDCLRCAAYFSRVVYPTHQDYATLAVQFAKQ